MKKSKAETAATRQRIVQAAAQAFRNNGIHATGVAEIMSAAGLTPGGFYRHFSSKDHLVAEACAAGMESTLDAIDASANAGERAFIEHFQAYLSDKNRRDCLGECPLIAMGSELARADTETRRAATNGYREIITSMAEKGATDDGAAMFAFSALLGALTMSRIVDDPALSSQILAETKERITGHWLKPIEAGPAIQRRGDDVADDVFIGSLPDRVDS
ncbi:TetR/AcrR family transcriptional repressor of nem operon [Paraburkholderia sp. GAS199]|uniref:TetR/AcrR family transcriptional regulator n=1 Tax=Paraburkholderia sp. GAS199 TaxID=3035126 RepID=UPI003D1CF98A